MIGAVIGDIVGSRFEWDNIKTKEFDLFSEKCMFTDDSVMSIAIAKAILDCDGSYENLGQSAIKNMQKIGRKYPSCGYGPMFRDWLFSENPEPYNSYGNGSAMRVSACGFVASSLEQATEMARQVTEVTHNHKEGIRGAEATAAAIFLARQGKSKEEIRDYINSNYYTLDFTLDEIRPCYDFDVSCQGSVPQAIVAFLESNGFEDAIRNAISIGGDSDTLAAITGGIAEAYYGVPNYIKLQALSFLDDNLREIVDLFEEKFGYVK